MEASKPYIGFGCFFRGKGRRGMFWKKKDMALLIEVEDELNDMDKALEQLAGHDGMGNAESVPPYALPRSITLAVNIPFP